MFHNLKKHILLVPATNFEWSEKNRSITNRPEDFVLRQLLSFHYLSLNYPGVTVTFGISQELFPDERDCNEGEFGIQLLDTTATPGRRNPKWN